MGSGASALSHYDGSTDDIPKELQELFEEVSSLKHNIAVKDAQFLHGQSLHKWKDHNHIIALLTERTKSQLFTTAKIFPEHDGEGLIGASNNKDSDGDNSDLLLKDHQTRRLENKLFDMLGQSPYAEFMKDCVMQPAAVDVDLLNDSLNYLGTNEYLLAEIICTSTPEEIGRTTVLFKKKTGFELLDRILKKTRKESSFQNFMKRILTETRSTSCDGKEQNLEHLVETLHKYGLGNDIPRDDDQIFRILAKESRECCKNISEVFEKTHQINLYDAINSTFKGSIALALSLWVEGDISDAIARRIEHNLLYVNIFNTNAEGEVVKSQVDARLLSHIFAKYDHWQLKTILESYTKLYDADLVKVIDKRLTGKYRRAVIAWITNDKTCDGGYEYKVWSFLVDHSAENYASLMSDPLKITELTRLLKKQRDCLLAYAESHHINLPPSITRRKAHEAGVEPTASDSYEENYKLVRDYLLEMIKIEDFDNSGMLDENDLWLILTDMELGYTEEEMAAFASWIDVDSDGHIDYNEVLQELTDDIIQVIESVGRITVAEKIAELRMNRDAKFNKLHISLNESGHVSDEVISSPKAQMPPSLMQYLKDTFEEVDKDHNGTLNPSELNDILQTVLAKSEGDEELLNIEWDKDHDGAVSWEEASRAFGNIFKKYINLKQDYWIALVDKTNGQYFWYNVRDGNSFWMTDEDQARYQARHKDDHLVPSSIPRKANHSEDSSLAKYQELRRIQKEKFEAVKAKRL